MALDDRDVFPFTCPQCGNQLDGLDEDLDDPGVFVCDDCGLITERLEADA